MHISKLGARRTKKEANKETLQSRLARAQLHKALSNGPAEQHLLKTHLFHKK